MNPFKYRPGPPDPNDDETDEWADNWLSNSMAWASRTFVTDWCETPEHWTSKLEDYFHTSCPCCLFIRGIFVGAFLIIFLDMLAIAVYMSW